MKFNLNDYHIKKKCLLSEERIQELFKKYLEEYNCEILFELYIDINILVNLKEIKINNILEFKNFIKKYIDKIPINKELIKATIESIENLEIINNTISKMIVNSIVNDLLKIINSKLLVEYLPRFLERKKTILLFQKYKNNTSVLVLKKTLKFQYKESSFQDKFITEKDFNFLNEISLENNWKLLIQDSELNTYFCNEKVIMIIINNFIVVI